MQGCHDCHYLSHFWIDYQWYQYPICLQTHLGHNQSRCPAHHPLLLPCLHPHPHQPPLIPHSSCAAHCACTAPVPVPPLRSGRACPTIIMASSLHPHHPRQWSTAYHHNTYSYTPSVTSYSPTSDNSDDMYRDDTWGNMTGFPEGGSQLF